MNKNLYRKLSTVVMLSSIVSISACSSDDSGDDDKDPAPNEEVSEEVVGSFAAQMESPILDFSNETAYWDMESNSIVTEDDDWEIAVRVANRDYQLLVNGGASGEGSAGVGVLQVDSAFDVTDPANTEQVYKYFGDSVSGTLSTPGSYGPFEYSVEGNHQMWPTYATYLVKDSSENYYKFQILGNYGDDGSLASGNLVVRYESAASDVTTAALDATDASMAAKFDLMNGSQTSDESWHFAYQRYTGFKLNGGDSGAGGVSACVVHDYPDLYDDNGDAVVDNFKAHDRDTSLTDFQAVAMDEASCIDGNSLTEDTLQPQIDSAHWLLADYSTGAPVFSASSENSNGWIIRSASQVNGEYNYARILVKTLSVDLSGAPVRQIVLGTETWEMNGD